MPIAPNPIVLENEKTGTSESTWAIHGSIENLTLNDAPGVVLSSCGLGSRVSDGKLVVFVAKKR